MKNKFYLYITAFVIAVSQMPLFADGFIVLPNPHPALRTPYPLEVKYHNVDVRIDGLVAETSIDQEFVNPTGFRLEGYYLFPVPKDAVIRNFSMYIDGRETQAELLDASKARSIYEDIVRKQLDPALLEYSGRSIFKVRIFPIEPRSSKRVKIKYVETLSRESGSVEYLYPLNTEKFSARELESVKINVAIKSDKNISNIYCPTHETTVKRSSKNTATVIYSEKKVKPDSDFRLYYSEADSGAGTVFRTYRNASEDGFFFMNISPPFEAEKAPSPKDIVFVLDTSGSMAGEKLDQAKKALKFCVSHLNNGDHFQIIRFSTEADSLFDSVQEFHTNNAVKATRYIESFQAIGGTNIEDAMKKAIDSFRKSNRTKIVVFITDGKPTIGETDEDKLVEQIKKANIFSTRIFTFGIGNDVNTHLLDKLTDSARGYRTYLAVRDNLEEKVSAFYSKIQSPVLTDISVRMTNVKVTKLYPKDIPDLFSGSSLSILGRYSGSGESVITLEGKIGGRNQRYSFIYSFPKDDTNNDYIPPLWATRRVGALIDIMRLNGENKELIDEITSLARQYGIITPYTSYLILEDETRKSERRFVSEDHLTLKNVIPAAPEAMREYKKDFYSLKSKSGEQSIGASSSVQNLSMADNAQRVRIEQNNTKYSTAENSRGTSLSSKIKNIAGRTFYNTGKFWIDPRIQIIKNVMIAKIRFASEEYFNLLLKDPYISQYLSIGKNVRFVYNSVIYEIYE